MLADARGMARTKTLLGGLMLTIALLPGCDDQGAETVGPRGGVVTSPDGRVTLEVPAGALETEVFITIGELDEEGPDGSVTRVYEIEPRFAQLQVPATLTFDMAVAPEGVETLQLEATAMQSLAVLTQKADGWDRLADREFDVDLSTVSGSVLFLSSYAVAFLD
jgi:hypothetical protein